LQRQFQVQLEELVLIQAESNYEDVEIEWSTENGNITVLNGLNIVADTVGQYTVEVSYLDVCFDSFTFDVGIDPFGIDVDITQLGNLSCLINQSELEATVSANNVSIEWSTENGTFNSGIDTFNPTISEPGTYVLNVELDENCMGVGEITVPGFAPLALTNTGGPYVISCTETNFPLSVGTNYSGMDFEWDDSDGNIFANQNTLTPQVSEGGDYIISASYGSCEDELIVFVDEDLASY